MARWQAVALPARTETAGAGAKVVATAWRALLLYAFMCSSIFAVNDVNERPPRRSRHGVI
jgi:hypothetical protein